MNYNERFWFSQCFFRLVDGVIRNKFVLRVWALVLFDNVIYLGVEQGLDDVSPALSFCL